MSAARQSGRHSRYHRGVLIEGYTSRFGEADACGDIIRPGAFARSLRSTSSIAMLWQHRPSAPIGRWLRVREDGNGLHVRNWVEAAQAQSSIAAGLNGLSIGFRPRLWRALHHRGRQLADIDLVEISLVTEPMLTTARFSIV